MSHDAASNNIVLKVTMPKRTGRKRKRGSDEPFSGDINLADAPVGSAHDEQVCSVSRLDDPTLLLRKLQDNVDRYRVEAVGSIKESHRYRGLSDFQFASTDLPFLKKVAEHLVPMQGMLHVLLIITRKLIQFT